MPTKAIGKHFCGGQQRTLGTSTIPELKDGKDVYRPAVPANPDKCPNCGDVIREWTAAELAAQKVVP